MSQPGVAGGGLLDADLGRIGDGVRHAVAERHHAVMPGLTGHLLCLEGPSGAGNDERGKNEYGK